MSVRRRRLVLAPDARTDLGNILLDSQERWGKQQRASYKSLIDRSLRLLARFPDMGQKREEVSPGLRSHPVGSHLILYRVTDEELIVLRIVHQRRDLAGISGLTSTEPS